MSSIYYALFHALARCGADMMVGGAKADRSTPAWKQVYRALDHRLARDNCRHQATLQRFPEAVQDFAEAFVFLQAKRHSADYDPFSRFYKSAVQQDIADARDILERFNAVPTKDRRAFAALVLFKRR